MVDEISAFERVKIARHPERPYSMDLFRSMFTDFVELHGDRRYADDAALVGGFAKLDDIEVMVLGQQKGRDTKQRRVRNFGMPKPEGYRKALRLMKLAEKFSRPIITFIDTPGAYPGIDAEERGQAEAIAFNLREMANLKVPIVSVVLGEGGSGGALAIAIADKVFMMENAVYSVISPEGCAAILWKDAAESGQAANSLGLTAIDLEKNNVIDGIIPEMGGWKMADPDEEGAKLDDVTAELKNTLLANMRELISINAEKRLENRFAKFRGMGNWTST